MYYNIKYMFKYGSIRLFFFKTIFGALFVFFSIIGILSLITFSPEDLGFGNYRSGNEASYEINNIFGYAGSYLAGLTKVIFNDVGYLFYFFFFISGINLLIGRTTRYLLINFFLFAFSIFSICFILTAFKINPSLLGGIFNHEEVGLWTVVANLNVYLVYLIFSLLFLISISLYFFSLNINNNFFIKIFKKMKLFLYVFLPIIYFFKFLIKSKKNKNKFVLKKSSNKKSEPTIKREFLKNKKNTNQVNVYNKELFTKIDDNYSLPSIDLVAISDLQKSYKKEMEKNNLINAEKLEKILKEFGVDGKITGFQSGPVVTLFEFVPAPGIKNSKVISLSNDIARAMSSISARISSQPGKTTIGIEIPNPKRDPVYFGDLIKDEIFDGDLKKINLALGKDISGKNVYANLREMPHLLIAGTTGSGKSVGINCMIMSILYKFKPSECKLILIDPKMLELSVYENIPHLLTPVVTDPKKSVMALKWVVREMENRYRLMSSLNVKNIYSYNELIERKISKGTKLYKEVETGFNNETKKPIIEKREISLDLMPMIVVVIDEMADLMMVAGKEVENLVQRLAQMARAAGIHLITATQRPSVDVITGTIKANFPSRISYKVSSRFDSRTIINEMGAEQLLGSGDMLFLENGTDVVRLHGGFISEKEIINVVDFIKSQLVYSETEDITSQKEDVNSLGLNLDNEVDELYERAVKIILEQQKVSTSFIQRYLQIGYNRAARIVEKMEESGIISEANNAGKRIVLKKK